MTILSPSFTRGSIRLCRSVNLTRIPLADGCPVVEVVVAGWRLHMEHTAIESHEIESSRRITATSFRVTRPHNSPLTTRKVHASMKRLVKLLD